MAAGRAGIGRRQFLAGLAGGALAAAAPFAPARALAPDTAWRDLAERLSGPVLRPGDAGFGAIAQPNNLRYAGILPSGIARCLTVEDVREAIAWARRTDTPLVARSGGHSYAGFSCTTGLMVDLGPMQEVAFDPGTGIATVAGGARNRQVYDALRPVDATITHGRCFNVGAAAFLLGGGIGFNMRALGFGSDLVVETEMVTADGEIVTASARENPDLFWGCRGAGGGNLGISTSFRVQTSPARPIVVFQLGWSSFDQDVAAALLEALSQAPDTLGSKLSIVPAAPHARMPGGALIGQIHGSRAELLDILAPAYRAAAPTSEAIDEVPYWDGQTVLSEEGAPAFYHESSRFVTQAEALAALPVVLAALERFPGPSAAGYAAKFFQTGGRTRAVAADATAFVHRGSDWLFSLETTWTEADGAAAVDRLLAWQEEVYDAVCRQVRGGAYQNFPDIMLADAAEAYYGANLPRLRALKAKVDPDMVFRFAQAIAPA